MNTNCNADCNSEITTLSTTDLYLNQSMRSPWYSNIWRYLVHQFLNYEEPRVWQEQDWFGQTHYYIYNPHTKRLAYCSTECEVRVCLEQLLYR